MRFLAFALLLTTLLDTLVTFMSGPGVAGGIGLRFWLALGTALVGLFAGRSKGIGRALVGIGALSTTVVQIVRLFPILLAPFREEVGLVSMIPPLISAVSVLLVGARTVWVAFRRRG